MHCWVLEHQLQLMQHARKGICGSKILSDFPIITNIHFRFASPALSFQQVISQSCGVATETRPVTCKFYTMLRCLLRKGKALACESSVCVQIENCALFLRWKKENAMYPAYGSSKAAGGSLYPPSPRGIPGHGC